ncbi:hypothetical protein DFS33DRAFT_1445069 [Desarmillaria ectypa]|nr:hypothetical protein DFS33DRAFT_1445069 [Desarmillaria ectypa]
MLEDVVSKEDHGVADEKGCRDCHCRCKTAISQIQLILNYQAITVEVPPKLIEHILDELSDHHTSLIAVFCPFPSLPRLSPVPSLPNDPPRQRISAQHRPLTRNRFPGQEPQLPPFTNVTLLHSRGHLDDLRQIDFLAITSLTLEDISLSLVAVAVHYPTPFGAYTVARGPAIEPITCPGRASASHYIACANSSTEPFYLSTFIICTVLYTTRGTLRELDMKLVFYGARRMDTAILDISQV